MNTIRLRIAVLGCIAPFIAMVTLNREPESTTSGPVSGRVSYKGRPLQQGAILFVPIKGEFRDWVLAPIGKDGRYSTEIKWRQGDAKTARYRICLMPFRATSPPEDRSPSPNETPQRDTPAAAPPHEILDSHQPMCPDLPVPQRFTQIETSGLSVTLDRDTTRVDVDLKD
jgi:hypothetical protein